MEKNWANFIGVRLVFGKTSPLLKTVVSAAIALSTVVLITLSLAQWEARAITQQLQQKAAALVQENTQLQERIDDLGTVESLRRIAQQELGLVEPGTIMIDSE